MTNILILATVSLLVACVPKAAIAGTAMDVLGIPEDAKLNMDQQLTKYGYPHEIHYITTADGYILKCYRVTKCTSKTKLPLVIMHALLANSLDFLVAGEKEALGYLAAAACYDTWLCNSRGNFESRNHTTLDPNKRDFWRFSWHEMGQYDLPAIFRRVLQVTGKKKLNYVGHSQGTTQVFVYCSLYPEESKAILNHVHALSPVAFLKHTSSPFLKALARNIRAEKKLSEALGLYEFMPRNNATLIAAPICSLDELSVANVCADFIFLVGGDNPEQFNKRAAQLAIANDPAGSSFNQTVHYAQLINSGKFEFYDHNMDSPDGNMKHYGQPTPPLYAVEKIKVPMTFYYGRHDIISNYTDVLELSKLIPNVRVHELADPKSGHLTFTVAKDIKKLVNDVVLANMEM